MGAEKPLDFSGSTGNDTEDISSHIYQHLRGVSNLVFANSRSNVEIFSDKLRHLCERNRVPNEFVPHHGNLSKELREFAEKRLKQDVSPTTALCTSTLELGIDIGQVTSIGQIGAPFSVASMRQRLGRSGRRDSPSVLRMYISEVELASLRTTTDSLRPELVQGIAMVELLADRWCEPPVEGRLHLSTLVHQVLALIAERGGVHASTAWDLFCGSGVFPAIDKPTFAMLLQDMGDQDLISQMDEGVLVHGLRGERIVNHFTFYAVFETPEEFRILHDGKVLGTMSLDQSVVEGNYIIFGGRRWKVLTVDQHEKRVDVIPGPGGKPPMFNPNVGGMVHDEIRRRMSVVYEGDDVPSYVNPVARALLAEARESYQRLCLTRSRIVADGVDTLIFACRGDRIMNTLAVMLAGCGISTSVAGPTCVALGRAPEEIVLALREVRGDSEMTGSHLASSVGNKLMGKYDWVLSERLLNLEYASSSLDVAGARSAIDELLRS
jgi:ATP-dependent Lhr-like helicase